MVGGHLVFILAVLSSVVALISALVAYAVTSKPSKPTDLVIAYCTEDISWLTTQYAQYRTIFIYSKCGKPLPPHVLRMRNVKLRPLQNIGSCDYVFLTHIIAEWGRLDGMLTFGKGRDHAQKSLVLAAGTPHFDSVPVHLTWSLENWSFTNNQSQLFEFHRSGFRNHGSWIKDCFGREMADHLLRTYTRVAYGGWFTVNTEDLKRFPLRMYQRMRSYQKYANEEVDHFIERSWGMLLTSEPSNTFGELYFASLDAPHVDGVAVNG